MERAKYAGLVLAAGFSSRMGKLKPLLPLGKETALRRLINSYKYAGVDEIFVVTGHERERVEVYARDVHRVFNPDFEKGMITSIKAGLREALKYDWDGVMFTPVDHALIRPYALKLLMREFTPEMEMVAFPTYLGRRGHPPLITRGIARRLCEHEGTQGAKRFLFSQGEAALDVEVGSGDMFADMDTPEDYERMRELCSREAPTAAECEALLRAERTPGRVVDHCMAVAERALGIADDAESAGYRIDKSLVFAAALLHDIKKTEPRHAQAGAEVLRQNGFPRVAEIISEHMDLPESRVDTISESSVVYLADKETSGTEFVTLEDRIAKLPPDKARFGADRLRIAAIIRDGIYW